MVYSKGWFTHHQICRQDLLVKKKPVEHKSFSKHKKTGLIFFYFGLPFRQRMQRVNWLQLRTLLCCIKLCFGDIQLSL